LVVKPRQLLLLLLLYHQGSRSRTLTTELRLLLFWLFTLPLIGARFMMKRIAVLAFLFPTTPHHPLVENGLPHPS
jgi:hypothetical protein